MLQQTNSQPAAAGAIEFSLNILVALTQKLTALVNNETECLKNMKIKEIAGLQKEKNEVAALLEKQQKELRQNNALRTNLSETDKALLRRVAMDFDEAIKLYQQELFKARKVNEIVINKIIEVVKEHVTRNRSYNRSGTRVAHGMELAKNTPAIKFNAQV